jgi:ATP-binding cassette subfamily B protein
MRPHSISTWKVNQRLVRFRPWAYLAYSVAVVFFLVSRLVPGLVEKSIFDRLSAPNPATADLWGLFVLLIAVEASRAIANLTEAWADVSYRLTNEALLRKNILSNILRRPAADALSVTPGDAINRLDDDVSEVSDFPLWIPHVLGHMIFAIVAVVIMFRINPTITAVVVLPLLGVAVLTHAARNRLLRYWHARRDATSEVVGFLGEMFGAVQAVKVAHAERDMVEQFQRFNQMRLDASVKERVSFAVLHSASAHLADVGVGVILLLAGQALSAGAFTLGDFALFTSYLFFTTHFPSQLGGFIADYRTQAVSIDRMLALQPDAPPESLVAHGPVYVRGDSPRITYAPKTAVDRLQVLQVTGLTFRYPENGANGFTGIEGIDLCLQRGSFTVITGRVGSGKTTLLRVLLGLLPRDAGQITWNGLAVGDGATFFVPPRCAYTPQVPRLFSEPLRDNILLGLREDQVDLRHAIEAAVLEEDVDAMPDGLDTVVGPRGVRLSGGQLQRAAAARMFVRQPELLVFDDISSALDVETERKLWERQFRARGNGRDAPTCLVVSHREAVLRRADHIILLQNGRVADQGTLDALLSRREDLAHLTLAHGGDTPSGLL